MSKICGITKRHLKRLAAKEVQKVRDQIAIDNANPEPHFEFGESSRAYQNASKHLYQPSTDQTVEYQMQEPNWTIKHQETANINKTEEMLKQILDQLEILNKKMDKIQNDIIQIQNEGTLRIRLISEQTVLLKKLVAKAFPAGNINIFPIKTMKELKEIDEVLQNTSEDEIIAHIKNTIGPNLKKCIPLTFKENVLMEINWSGLNEKYPIRNIKLFNSYFYEAFKQDVGSYKEFEDTFKRAISTCKNNIYKAKCRKKNNTQE